jgi:hypothetical protein
MRDLASAKGAVIGLWESKGGNRNDVKSAAILAAVSLVLAFGVTLLIPACVPCVGLVLGFGAGILAGVFDKPSDAAKAAKAGVGAGALGSVGAIVAQMVGAGVNALVVGPEGAAQLLEQWGMSTDAVSGASFWTGAAGSAWCLSLLDIALMAGLGALGGLARAGGGQKRIVCSQRRGKYVPVCHLIITRFACPPHDQQLPAGGRCRPAERTQEWSSPSSPA